MNRSTVLPALAMMLVLGAPLAGAGRALAAPVDPAAQRIEAFDSALIDVMRGGAALGAKGRYRKLAPAVEAAFDMPVMTRFAVGPAWATMSESDHQALIKAFTRLSTASYAHNFDSFDGQHFVVDDKVETRGLDKIVQSHIIQPHAAPVALTYRMRQSADGWKIIDVYYNGTISQLTTRRADFAASLAAGGAKALLVHLDALTQKLVG